MPDLDSLSAGLRAHLQSRQTAAHSMRAYLGDLRAFANWFATTTGETFDPASTVRRDIQGWRDELAKTCKPATVNRKLSTLRIFFDWAVRKGLTTTDPAGRVHGLRQVIPELNVPGEAAVEKVLRAARTRGSRRDRAMLELLASAGLRVSELAALRRADLELGQASAWLNVPGCKNRRARRIPLNVRARVALKEYLEERGELQGSNPLFMSRLGKAVTPYAIWYTVKKYASMAGAGDMSPRSFRNATIARLARDPHINLVTAAAFLGQDRLEVLARFIQPDDMQKITG